MKGIRYIIKYTYGKLFFLLSEWVFSHQHCLMASTARQGFCGRRANLNRKQVTYPTLRAGRGVLCYPELSHGVIACHVMSVFCGRSDYV